ncbi:Putative dde superfamily endonuclease, partial [Caligus rogercresseyi]
MAKEENMSEGSMINLVKKDLGMTPYKKIRLQLLSEATIEKRRERGRILLNKLKSGTQGPVFYTDEKLFTVQAVYNSQNDRILAKSSADIPVKVRGVFRRQKPKSVMVWAGVMSDGKKSPLIFVPEGVKINKEVYLSMLNDQVLPWIKA